MGHHGGKAWWGEHGTLITWCLPSESREKGTLMFNQLFPSFSSLFSLGHQPMGWCHLCSWYVIPAQVRLSETPLTDVTEVCLLSGSKSNTLTMKSNHHSVRDVLDVPSWILNGSRNNTASVGSLRRLCVGLSACWVAGDWHLESTLKSVLSVL